jgi:hypothetical protein
MYENDYKVLDCEIISKSPKKRLGMQTAERNYLKQKNEDEKLASARFLNPESLEVEKKKI